MWMLREAGVPVVEIAAAFGLSRKTIYQITSGYELRLNRRDDTASSWNEPWARRLKAAGAIR